ncbi:hypothetical protein D9758_009356 [Tetrapyrgos nigripes]|uniref:Uncharacterized protein n=1 Tax=Tetrapyrgos nigripes TaxID=182062 RepID=A0A8H5GGZ3_9AGAR|nr:hypothetical protein D9758_009356 [Tetrapyrgos nigripes]
MQFKVLVLLSVAFMIVAVPLAEEARTVDEEESFSKRVPHTYKIIEDESLSKRVPHTYTIIEDELAIIESKGAPSK